MSLYDKHALVFATRQFISAFKACDDKDTQEEAINAIRNMDECSFVISAVLFAKEENESGMA